MVEAIDRVLARIEIIPMAGCWIFMGALHEAGYGMVGLGSREAGIDRVHRVAYRHFVGPIPEGMFVLHRCDVPCCCNPSHLFVGTAMDNTQDMIRKGRGSTPPRNLHDRGSHRYNAKLDEDRVRDLRLRVAHGETKYAVWKWLNENVGYFAQRSVYRMLNRQTWAHVS